MAQWDPGLKSRVLPTEEFQLGRFKYSSLYEQKLTERDTFRLSSEHDSFGMATVPGELLFLPVVIQKTLLSLHRWCGV